VICTQGRLAVTAETTPSLFGLTRDDVTYQSMPLFHGNAIMANWLPALRLGATVSLRRKFSASGFLGDVRRYRATYFNYVGRALAYILATPPAPYDRDNQLRLGFGTEASARDMERFAERFGCQIMESYGSSEGVMSIRRRPDAPPTAIGLPASETMDVIIANRVTGDECPRARFDEYGRMTNGDQAIGEIVSRNGASSFEGYYDNDDAMADRLVGGWYWSGDLGYRDVEGWFYFAGRASDWLRVDSENFAAAPVERILFRFPGVIMAGVYPVPDCRTGDQVMAALELEEGKDFDPAAFRDFLSEQADLGTKWAPRYVRIVNNMPLTSTGKINKQPLRLEQWATTDPVWWAEEPGGPYRPLGGRDRHDLGRRFEIHDRAHLLPENVLAGE
jgi:fatty-acyl-CoA synthase